MKINVGCGNDILDGWTNVDLYPSTESVIRADIRLLPFAAGTIESIRAIDVLEHIPRADVAETLSRWFMLLQRGGTLEIRCPDVQKQCELLLDKTWPTDVWAHMVFGGQDAPGNFHMAGFSPSSLAEKLVAAGFVVTAVKAEHGDVPKDGNANFRIFAKKP